MVGMVKPEEDSFMEQTMAPIEECILRNKVKEKAQWNVPEVLKVKTDIDLSEIYLLCLNDQGPCQGKD